MGAPQTTAVRFRVDPRDVPPVKAARLLGLTLPSFEDVLPRLRERGFPVPDPDTGHFDVKAIEDWMDRRSGLAKVVEARDADAGDFSSRLGRIRGTGRQR
ncbi:hypothetical protein [Lichenibacterium dinghuense]|uniref:hypothetical protein n=1 Tax=Lichenibacterium dinghuense TaxID=2895977 RepID=UPI001F2EB2C5|nr:hypothetical protein [Lichenibacterium sp. 6Y81]